MDSDVTSFSDMDLSPVMRRSLQRAGYETPSPVQSKVIPLALEGFDVIGQARTGTGKTASFGIPILEQLDPIAENPLPQALILVPTRELAGQVHDEIVKLAYGCPTECLVVSGGKDMHRQLKALKAGVQIVVGTPGRVLDHIQRGTFKTSNLWCVVLDEADRMLDIGFRPDIERILRRCPEDRQTLLLSATLAPEIQELAGKYLFEPVVVDCSLNNVSVETIEQRYISVDRHHKVDTLIKLLKREHPPQAIIFCRTKIGTAKLHRRLDEALADDPILSKFQVETIHGNMNQRQRDRVFQMLRDGKIRILVATDVVGRGIDVSTISHIINFDVPQDCDDYVHRVGRTGRMGREGIAFTFICKDEGDILTSIESRINCLLLRDSLNDDIEQATKSEAEDSAPETPAAPAKRRLNMSRRPPSRSSRLKTR